MNQQPPYQRILVIRYRFIGDTLLAVPFLRNLRRAYPEAKIDVLLSPFSGEVLTDCPYVDELIYFDTNRKHRYENHGDRPLQSFWSYVGMLRRQKYDAVFVLKRSFSSAILAALAGIPNRIGFDTEHRKFLLTQAVPYDTQRPEADCFMDLLRAVNIPVTDHHLEAWWSEQEDAMAEAIYDGFRGDLNVLIHMTSSNTAKQWTEESWIRMARWLIEEHHATLHCLGAPGDAPVYESLRKGLPEACRTRFQNWCGHTTILESLAFIKRMDFAVGVDSGTLHMAAAVGTPVIALFGPMNENKWGPPGEKNILLTAPVDCRPCNLKTPCRFDLRCMKDLSVEKVQDACKILLNS
jgi:heptosyltransferase-2